jgi:hypothetical protein
MENLISKWKKMMNNEKTNSEGEETVFMTTKRSKKGNSNSNNSSNNNSVSGNFNKHATLESSLIKSERENAFSVSNKKLKINSKLTRTSSETNINDSSRKYSNSRSSRIMNINEINENDHNHQNNQSYSDHELNDRVLLILNKTINYLQKTKEKADYLKITEYINEAIENYIKNLNNNKINSRNLEEKEILWQTKSDTTGKIIKDFELKVLTLEKDKVS